MGTLRLFPVWQLTPRSVEVELPAGAPLRDAVARALDILGGPLQAVDREGRDASLDAPATDRPSLPDLAVSSRPIRFPMGLFEEAALQPDDPAVQAAVADPGSGRPSGWDLMTAGEQALACGLQALGIGLDPQLLDLDRLAESFPQLEGGYGLTQASPYRLLFAVATIFSEQGIDQLERLEAATERLADRLWKKLWLTHPDALDLRLHLFADWSPESRALLRRRLEQTGGPALPGRCHRGWRRVIVHPCRDASDRLGQMANLGRRLAVERADAGLRQLIQAECGAFVTAGSDEAWLDFQAQVEIRPVEHRLRAQAEQCLLDRLGTILTDTAEVSSGLSTDWAVGVLRRAGFFELQFETDGPRLAEVAWQLAAEAFRRFDERELGGGVDQLSAGQDQKLREWLERFRDESGMDLLPAADLDRIVRTLWVDVACRLRSEIETLVELRAFPPYGSAEISFAQLLDILRALRDEIERCADPRQGPSPLRAWMEERQRQLDEELPRLRVALLEATDTLAGLAGFFKGRFGRGGDDRHARIAGCLEALRRAWLERCALGWLLAANPEEASHGFELVGEISARLAALARAAAEMRQELAKDLAAGEAAAGIGTIGSDGPLPPAVAERVRRGVEELPLDEPLREVLRRDGELRDLFHLRPDSLLGELLDRLDRPLGALAREVAADAALPGVDRLLPAAVDRLFLESLLPHSGRTGTIGALDSHTHLMLIRSPELERQLAEEELRGALRRRLMEIGVQAELPVAVLTSRAAPGLMLVRCVHGLSPREVTG